MDNELEEYLVKYQTPESRKQLLEYILNGKTSPFWVFITEFLTKNIEDLTEAVLDPGAIEAKEIDRIRDKIKLQKGLLKLPDTIIAGLTASAVENRGSTEIYD